MQVHWLKTRILMVQQTKYLMSIDKLFFILPIFMVGLISQPIYGQQDLSLEQAIEIGLRNNFQIQIAEKQIEIATNNNDWGATGKYPEVNLNAFYNNRIATLDNPIGFINGELYNGDITANIDAGWILFDGFKVDINKKRLEELEKQTNSNSKLVIEDAIQQIINAYYNTLIQQKQLEVFEDVLEISEDRVRFQKIRQEYGQASSYDILQTEDAFLSDSTNLIIQEYSLSSAKRNLLLAMGERVFDKEFTLTDELADVANVYVYEELENKMLSENKDIQALLVGRELASINAKLAKSNRYPRISVNGGLNLSGSMAKLFSEDQMGNKRDAAWGKSADLYVNFRGTYNLFDGGTRTRSIQNAEMEEMISALSIEDAKRSLKMQLRNIYEDYENQRRLLNISDKLIENAKKNLEISTERFKAGQINSFEYRTIQLAYINASQAKLNAIFNLKNTETELVKLVGGLIR